MFNAVIIALGGAVLSKDNLSKRSEIVGSVLLSLGLTRMLGSITSDAKKE